MRTQYLSFLFILSLFATVNIQANKNEKEMRFFNISIAEGLSQSTVYDIEQDSLGNIWVGTVDGLNKYDGYRFTIYRHEEGNPNSLQSDYIRSLKVINKERLLIGSRRGLTVYDIKKNIFTNHSLDKEVHHIITFTDSLHYLLTPTDLYKYNSDKNILTQLYTSEDLQLSTAQVYKNKLIIGTNKGIFSYENGKLEKWDIGLDAIIQDIKETSKGLWIATEGKGLYFLTNEGILKNYIPKKSDQNSLISAFVRRLEVDSHNRLWVGTMDGLSIYNEKEDSFNNYEASQVKKGTLSQNSVRSMFLDKQGGMWLGTYFGGINYFHPLQNQFGKISHIPFSNSLSDNIVSCIVEGKQNELWIGTNEQGLNKYDLNSGKFSYYTIKNGLLSNNIKAVLVDNYYVYVGSHGGGMARIDTRTNSVKNYTSANSQLGSNNVYSFAKDNSGHIWIATLDGLKIFDAKSEVFHEIVDFKPIGSNTLEYTKDVSTEQIYALYKDSKNRIWIGSELGIYTFSTNNNLLVHYDIGSLKRNERINCFLEDHNKQIWLGMHSGLGLLNENMQQFKIYNTKDGLPNNTIYGILEDSYNKLWISTNKGLASIAPNFERIKQYTIKDGIQSDQFNHYSYCRTQSGEMFFGGINGITHFHAEHLIDNPYTPEPIISELRLFNNTVLPNDNTSILSENISYTSKLRLEPNQNSFSFLVTVPNYLSQKHNVFAYKLEGEDTEWTEVHDSHPISYSNLSAGRYKFLIKAGNSEGKWNEKLTSLDIEVVPHWWNTILFRLFAFILTASLAYYLIRTYSNRQQLKSELALERLEQDKKEEINQTKLRFFINISHEFRTPLTLIISPLKEMLNKTSDRWVQKQLEIVIRNATKLTYLVDQLMDYRKADLGVFALKVQEADPSMQVDEQVTLFNRLAKQKNIDFVYENNLDRDKILYDTNYFDLILSNLLSNAFKFTPQNGSITIRTFMKGNQFVLSVSDTGTGMKDETQQRVFERFYQASSEVKGTGVGLSLVKRLIELHHAEIELESKPNEGTTFFVSISQDESIYSEEEKSESSEAVTSYRQMSEEEINLLLDPKDFDEEENEELGSDTLVDRPTILVAEDDADVRNYIVSNLSDIANIERVDNGKAALAIINEKEIDLLITDVMMPLMDGIALCRVVKQNIKTSHIPVIMLTAKSTKESELEGFVAGADSYINKPFDISILKLKVRNMLRAKQSMLGYYSESLEIEPRKVTFNEMDREFLEKAKSIVEKNMDNISFSVDEFCKEMAMSRSNLHLKMKAITGESTIEFIRKIKFNEACNLLKDGRYPVAEVSLMVGFNTASYFTTSFKKYFGMLPSEYVKKQKGGI